MTRDYLAVEYAEGVRPLTDYPNRLAAYLTKRWGLRSGDSILDVGAGRAEMSAGFRRAGLRVTALDSSSEAFGYAEAAGVNFMAAAIRPDVRMPVKDESFDVVFCKSFIEHLTDPLAFTADCFRILKPGGRVIFLTPDWQANFRTFYDDVTHVRPFTHKTMRQLLELGGFEEVSSYRFRQLPVTWSSPTMNTLSAIVAPFVPVRTESKFFRWSRELMICGTAKRPAN